jgi:hypothetical protein
LRESIIDSVAGTYVDLGMETGDTEIIKIMAMVLIDMNIIDGDDHS